MCAGKERDMRKKTTSEDNFYSYVQNKLPMPSNAEVLARKAPILSSQFELHQKASFGKPGRSCRHNGRGVFEFELLVLTLPNLVDSMATSGVPHVPKHTVYTLFVVFGHLAGVFLVLSSFVSNLYYLWLKRVRNGAATRSNTTSPPKNALDSPPLPHNDKVTTNATSTCSLHLDKFCSIC
jgi:hypothetical protein